MYLTACTRANCEFSSWFRLRVSLLETQLIGPKGGQIFREDYFEKKELSGGMIHVFGYYLWKTLCCCYVARSAIGHNNCFVCYAPLSQFSGVTSTPFLSSAKRTRSCFQRATLRRRQPRHSSPRLTFQWGEQLTPEVAITK